MPLHHILLEAMKIAAVAEAYEVNCAPHNFYGHMSALMSALLRGDSELPTISRILPSPGATIVPRHRFFHARSDAGAASDLQRVGQARNLLGPCASRLFRYRAQSA